MLYNDREQTEFELRECARTTTITAEFRGRKKIAQSWGEMQVNKEAIKVGKLLSLKTAFTIHKKDWYNFKNYIRLY